MFVCLELDTEDLEVWGKIDTALTEKFTLLHALWGVESKAVENGNKPILCNLPSNLFYTDINESEADFQDRILPTIQSIWSGDLRIVCMDKSWTQEEIHNKTDKFDTSPSSEAVDIESVREE